MNVESGPQFTDVWHVAIPIKCVFQDAFALYQKKVFELYFTGVDGQTQSVVVNYVCYA